MSKIKCYKLNYGGDIMISDDIESVKEWIDIDMKEMSDEDCLEYEISVVYMTQEDLDNLEEL